MIKKAGSLIVSILLLFLFLTIYFSPVSSEDAPPSNYDSSTFSGKYYVWGDSVSRATYTADGGVCSSLPINGSGIFTYQMVKHNCNTGAIGTSPQHMYIATVCDWGSQTSSWGITYWNNVGAGCGGSPHQCGCGADCAVANHTSNAVIFEMFGINDLCHGTSAATCADNKYTLYTMAINAGMGEEYWIPCIWTLISSAWSGTYGNAAYPQQFAYMNASVDKFESKSIRYIKMYDAIDSNPYNGRYDPVDETYYYDVDCTGAVGGMHPNNVGHGLMGNFSWFFLSGQDKTITYPSNTRTQIVCNYNQTIYLHLRSGWAYGNTTVYCLDTGTNISWSQEVNYTGSSMIHFSGVNGYTYYGRAGNDGPIENASNEMSSIGGRGNSSFFHTNTPTINWTLEDNAVAYRLQIATDLDFSNVVVDIPDINEYTYPSDYSHNSTHASFDLPSEYQITVSDAYYFRVVAYK